MFGRSIPLFRLAGFQVGIDWSWPILAVLITWTLAVGVFPQYYPGLTPGLYLSMGVIAALGLFASIVLHELAHSLVARRYGVPIRGITLFIFGGVAQMDREPDRPGAEFAIAIAGPIASFLVAVACWLLLRGAVAAGAGRAGRGRARLSRLDQRHARGVQPGAGVSPGRRTHPPGGAVGLERQPALGDPRRLMDRRSVRHPADRARGLAGSCPAISSAACGPP